MYYRVIGSSPVTGYVNEIVPAEKLGEFIAQLIREGGAVVTIYQNEPLRFNK